MDTRAWAAGFVALAAAAALAHLRVLGDLQAYAGADSSASHVVLIPLVSAALVLYRRDEIFASVSTGWVPGLSLLASGAAISAVARITHPFTGQNQLALLVSALLVMWIGAFVLCFGVRSATAARFALAFLVFTIPIPVAIIDGATEVLKRGSSQAVALLFTLTGTTYHREGFVFSLPGLAIEVADACSGIRSSIALLLTALLAGHMFLDRSWKKLVLVAAILPITIFKNGLRIVSLSLLSIHVDPSFLVGRLHNDGGIAFFVLALALLLPVLGVLRRLDGSHAVVVRRPSPSL